MKRIFQSFIAAASLALLPACGGVAQVGVELRSTAAGATAGSAPAASLADAQSVTLTVARVSIHVAEDGEGADAAEQAQAAEPVTGEDAGAGGWTVLSSEERSVDLAAVGGDLRQPLGEAAVSAGRVTQIRLELKPGQDNGDGTQTLAGAVTSGGQTCDLILPSSVFSPGLKLLTPFPVNSGTETIATMLLDVRDSKRASTASCAYFLNPVLKLEQVAARASDRMTR